MTSSKNNYYYFYEWFEAIHQKNGWVGATHQKNGWVGVSHLKNGWVGVTHPFFLASKELFQSNFISKHLKVQEQNHYEKVLYSGKYLNYIPFSLQLTDKIIKLFHKKVVLTQSSYIFHRITLLTSFKKLLFHGNHW